MSDRDGSLQGRTRQPLSPAAIVGLVVGGLGLLSVLVIGATFVLGGFFAYANAPNVAETKRAALEAQRRAIEAEKAKLQRELEQNRQRHTELERQLASVKDEAERARLEAELAKARHRGRDLRPPAQGSGGHPVCQCQPGDALCSCL